LSATIAEAECYTKIAVDQAAVDRLLVELFIQDHSTPPTEIVLDLDATDDPVHGQQEGRFFHGFTGTTAICGSTSSPASTCSVRGCAHRISTRAPAAGRRSPGSSRSSARRGRTCASSCAATVRSAARRSWPGAKPTRWTTSSASRRTSDSAPSSRTNWPGRPPSARSPAGRRASLQKLSYHTRESWSRARRVWRKAKQLTSRTERDEGKRNPRFVVTSLRRDSLDARALYEDLYCARGEMENRIKEQHLMLFAEGTSAATMRANRLRLYFSSIAYVLVDALRRLALAGTALARAQVTTIRLTLVRRILLLIYQ